MFSCLISVDTMPVLQLPLRLGTGKYTYVYLYTHNTYMYIFYFTYKNINLLIIQPPVFGWYSCVGSGTPNLGFSLAFTILSYKYKPLSISIENLL